MEPKKTIPKVNLPKGVRIAPGLEKPFKEQPHFKDKVDRANHILKTFGLPKKNLG